MSAYFKSKRSQRGSQIAEGPIAVFILLFIVFFPLLDLIRLSFAFGAGWYLNFLNARIVSINAPPNPPNFGVAVDVSTTPAGPKVASQMSVMLNNGFGGALLSSDICKVTYLADPANPTQVGNTLVADTVQIKPFAFDSVMANIQGISGVQFQFQTKVLQEEKGVN